MLYYAVVASASSARLARAGGLTRALLSYADVSFPRLMRTKREFRGVLLDSGAFSAVNSGSEVNLDAYIQFCKRAGPFVDTYAALDVIWDEHGTRRNLERMESEGLEPLPTFHLGSSEKALRSLAETHDYIAIGGVAKAGRSRVKWLDWVWSILHKHHWPIRVHGWGATSTTVLERYPWYSVDSATWKVGWMYGHSHLNEGRAFKERKREQLPKHLSTRGHGANVLRLTQSARTISNHARYVTDLWKRRGVDWGHDDEYPEMI